MNAQSNSIGINKWSSESERHKVWELGEGDQRLIGWERADGQRAIETNGDVVFESEGGFHECWYANA